MADDFGLMDLGKVKPVPLQKTLLLVNNFVVNTTRFLNHFSAACEERLLTVSEKVTQLEIGLAMIEAKLRSVPELHDALLTTTAAGTAGAAAAPGPPQPPEQQSAQALPSVSAPPPPPPPVPSSEVNLAPPPPPPPAPVAEPAAAEAAQPEPAAAVEVEADRSGMVAVSQHPDYATFFKMVRVGVPDPVVRGKMGMLGLDPALLDDPNRLVPAPPPEEE